VAQGFTRFRKIQVGKQSVIGTVVPAARVLPFRSAVVLNPNRTDPDVDVGSLDPVIAPYATAQDVTMAGAAGPQTYNDLAIRMSAGIKGGVSPTGSAVLGYTYTFTAASLTADSFDYYSVETGDETADASGMGILGFGGVINNFGMTMPEDLGPWTGSDDWVFAGATYGNRTAALTPDANPVFMFGADTAFYLDSAAGSIGMTRLADAVRGASLTVSNNLDLKRFANGSNTRFQLGAYGRGARQIEFTVTVEKTAATIAEAITLDDTPTPNRYWKVSANSTETNSAGSGGTKAKADIYLPVRLFSWSEGEIGGNSTLTLSYRGFYDSTLAYAFKGVVVNSLATLP
jgi:hypothetical protein